MGISWWGTLSGAAAGFAVGSVVPGIGNVVGAVVGAGIGIVHDVQQTLSVNQPVQKMSEALDKHGIKWRAD